MVNGGGGAIAAALESLVRLRRVLSHAGDALSVQSD